MSDQAKMKAIREVLEEYHQVLMDDGVLQNNSMGPHDYIYLSSNILKAIQIAEIEEYEKRMIKDGETHVGEKYE